MEEQKPSFYANIPAFVRYNKKLSPNAKLLYGEITALCNQEGFCWSSNEYFSKLYEVSHKSVSRWISDLENEGYIIRELIYREGSKEVKQRRLYLCEAHRQKSLEVGTKMSGGTDKNVVDNNTTNNTTNNKDINTLPQQVEAIDFEQLFDQWYSFYPKKVNKKKAFDKFKLKVKKHGFEKVFEGMAAYAKVMELNGTEKQYIKGPDVFLNGEHYLDDQSELLKQKPAKQQQYKPWEELAYGTETNSSNNDYYSQQLPKPTKQIGW